MKQFVFTNYKVIIPSQQVVTPELIEGCNHSIMLRQAQHDSELVKRG